MMYDLVQRLKAAGYPVGEKEPTVFELTTALRAVRPGFKLHRIGNGFVASYDTILRDGVVVYDTAEEAVGELYCVVMQGNTDIDG